jgi:hypothetical protein
VHRAHANLHAISTNRLSFSDAGAVWWWFVPVLNLVQGLRITSEISRESGTSGREPVLPILCWAFAIVGTVVAGIGYALPGETLREIRKADVTILASMPILAVAWLLFIVYIQRVVSAQKRRAKELGLTS